MKRVTRAPSNARQERIKALAERLGVKLPEDYFPVVPEHAEKKSREKA